MKATTPYPTSRKSSAGFSAIELLVTLIIGVLFLAMGYSLYNMIVTSGAQSRHRAQADNVATEYLRKYETTVGIACIASTPVNAQSLTGESVADLADPKITINVTCPNASVSSISLVRATVTYMEGGLQKNVIHEVFSAAQ